MNHVFRWAVAAVSVIILTVVLASNAKAADNVGLELEPTVQLNYVNGKYQASSIIAPRGGCQYGYQLSLELHELKLKNTGYQINLATEQNQSDNVWGYLEGDKLKSEGEISSETNQPVTVKYEARPKADLPAGNYSGKVQYTITAKPAPEPVVEDKMSSWEYRDGDDVQASVKGENLFGIKSVELFDQSGKSIVSRTKEESIGDNSDGTSITFDFDKLSAGRYFATVYFANKSYKIPKPLVIWPQGDCVSGNSEFNKCKVVLPQSNDTKFIPVMPSSEGAWAVVSDGTSDDSQFGEWYDYGKKHWANIVEVQREKYRILNQPGTVLDKSDYIRHWSYIPRYNYKVQRRDAVDKPMSPHGNSYSFTVDFTQKEFRKPSPTCSNSNEPKDYLKDCNPKQPWATPPAFLQQNTLFDGIWLSDDVSIGAGDLNDLYRAAHSDKTNQHWLNNNDWGAMLYLAMSRYGVNQFNNIGNLRASCLAADDNGCWGVKLSENDGDYLVAAKYNMDYEGMPWASHYDIDNHTTDQQSALITKNFMNNCNFETCGGQALHELLASQKFGYNDDIIYDTRILRNSWMIRRRGWRLNSMYSIDNNNNGGKNTLWAWPVGGKNVVVPLLTAPQRLQPQLKAAQPNRINEQASSVKLETSQQVSGAEVTKTSERPTARPLDQQLSPTVRNRTEVTTNHAVVDDVIPQVKRQRQAVATGPVLRPNSAGGKISLVTGQSPVAGVLGTEQNFVKQGLTHANSLITAE